MTEEDAGERAEVDKGEFEENSEDGEDGGEGSGF